MARTLDEVIRSLPPDQQQDIEARAARLIEEEMTLRDLRKAQEFTQARLDGLKNLTSSFKSLYDSMPADQKKNADQVFRSYGPTNSASQG